MAALLLAGCAGSAPVTVPPVVDLPAPPAAPAATTARAPVTATPGPGSPAPVTPWVEKITRSETTKPVARCQIGPVSFSSTVAVESRVLDDGRLAMRVVQDDETAKGVEPRASLLGKGYVVDGALQVRGAEGGLVPDDQVARVRSLAAGFVGWPGSDVLAHLPSAGAEVPMLEGPVAAVADVPLHGGQVQPESKALVRFMGTRPGDAGDELVFDVTLHATEGDAGMCHRWTNEADVNGELRLRASNGALLGLHLDGTTDDTEALCQGASGKVGPPPPPRTCNRGNVSVDVKQPHAP